MSKTRKKNVSVAEHIGAEILAVVRRYKDRPDVTTGEYAGDDIPRGELPSVSIRFGYDENIVRVKLTHLRDDEPTVRVHWEPTMNGETTVQETALFESRLHEARCLAGELNGLVNEYHASRIAS